MNKLVLIFSVSLVLLATSLALARPLPVSLDFGSPFLPPSNSCDISFACVKSGGSCAGTVTNGNCNSNSTNSTCCGYGLFCVNSTCTVDTMGEWCNSGSDCVGGGPYVACQNNTCKQLGLPGDGCSSNTDCFYPSSVCGNSSLCVGKAVNVTCDSREFDCDAGLYCKLNGIGNAHNGTCQYQLPLNATCNAAVDVCALGNICNSNGTCVAPFQGGNGSKCNFDEECSADFYCGSNGACTSASGFTKTDCTNDTDCSSGSTCLCDAITGEQICVSAGVTDYCGDNLQSLYSCIGSNNCSLYYLTTTENTLNPDSCVATNCKSDFKKYNSCGCSTSKTLYGNCEQDQYCGGFPLWAIIVIAVVGVILVLVVIVVIVMVMRRRRSYDTIA